MLGDDCVAERYEAVGYELVNGCLSANAAVAALRVMGLDYEGALDHVRSALEARGYRFRWYFEMTDFRGDLIVGNVIATTPAEARTAALRSMNPFSHFDRLLPWDMAIAPDGTMSLVNLENTECSSAGSPAATVPSGRAACLV